MIKYIDFDNVILNTDEVLIREYYNDGRTDHKCFNDDEFLINYDYNKLLMKCDIINDAIHIIKRFDPKEVAIITKILSLDNEGKAKIEYLRKMGVKCNIYLVPEHAKKTDVVLAKGNILVDDSLHNMDDWASQGGISIFFNKYNKNEDGWGNKNTKYDCTDTLQILDKY